MTESDEADTATEPKLFRAVFHSDTRVRLRQQATDPAGEWTFRFDAPGNVVRAEGVVRDSVRVDEEGIPWQPGLEVAVEVEAEGVEEAEAVALSVAETALFMLACARRAPVRQAKLHVLYEIGPDVSERVFRQVFWGFPVPTGHATADQDAIVQLWNQLMTVSDRIQHRVVVSLSWFRLALEEADPLMRFVRLWLAAEALDPLLRDLYGLKQYEESQPEPVEKKKPPSNPGLRELERRTFGDASEVIRGALKLRWAVFHPQRKTRLQLLAMAKPVNGPLEDLIVAGWRAALGMTEDPFPETSVGPETMNFILDGLIVDYDVTQLPSGAHPHMVLTSNPHQLQAPTAPGSITVTSKPTFTLVNLPGETFRCTAQGLAGPSGDLGLTFPDPPEDAASE